MDVMPTCCEIAGVEYPETYNGNDILPAEGTSLVPAFTDGPLERNGPLFWEHQDHRAVRDGRWKLFDGSLYDLSRDPYEQRDLSKQYPEIVKRLQTLLDEFVSMQLANENQEQIKFKQDTLNQLKSLGYLDE